MKFVKSIVLSLMVAASAVFAGGNISPVVPVVEDEPIGIYVGGGLGSTWTYETGDFDFSSDTGSSKVDPAIGLRLGYEFAKYGNFGFAVEGRIVSSFDANDFDTTVYSAFLKPEYYIEGTEFGLYGLAGYSYTRWNVGDVDSDKSGFAFGLGAEYALTKNVSVSADWTSNVWKDDVDGADNVNNDVVMVWLNYKF